MNITHTLKKLTHRPEIHIDRNLEKRIKHRDLKKLLLFSKNKNKTINFLPFESSSSSVAFELSVESLTCEPSFFAIIDLPVYFKLKKIN